MVAALGPITDSGGSALTNLAARSLSDKIAQRRNYTQALRRRHKTPGI